MLGRWLVHIPRGRWIHANIANADAISGESPIGWSAHYAIGIAFAGLLLAVAGPQWASQPTPLPALAIGIVTVAAPLFILQPAMGAGVAASKTPRPGKARLTSLVSHTMFGVGLYAAAVLAAGIMA